MRALKLSKLLIRAACLLAASSAAWTAALTERIVAQDGWSAYRVAKAAGAGDPCCFAMHGKQAKQQSCDLDSRNWNFGTSSKSQGVASSELLAVYVRTQDGKIDRVRALSANCPVQLASNVRWINPVDAPESVATLKTWLASKSTAQRDHALAALAYHAQAQATQALANFTESTHKRPLREQALFWLAQTRGLAGAEIVERVATRDPDAKLRAHAVFALSQSKAGDPYLRIRAISATDSSAHVRSQALFWMAQMADPRAQADISGRLKTDRSEQVQEQAVFALSQLQREQADSALIGVLQGSYPRKVKERALFWLGQSGSPKAMQYFDRVLGADG